MRVDKSLPKSLSEAQVFELKQVLSALCSSPTFLSVRNFTIVYTYLYTGLRRNELLSLELFDLDFTSMTLRVRKGKGGKDRLVPIPDILGRVLRTYLQYREHIPTDVVFCSCSGLKLQKRDIQKFLNRLREKLSFYFTWHQLRHTYATHLINHGVGIYDVQHLLGHSRTTTTEIYLSFDVSGTRSRINSVF